MLIPTVLPACTLRPWRNADRASLLRYADDRRVWLNLTHRFPHPYTPADADDWLRVAALPGRSVHLAIDCEGEAVGGIGVDAGEGVSEATGDIGYWLGVPHWGRGLATASVVALTRRLVEQERRFARLQAKVHAWNPASMRVLEKAVYVREGLLRRSVDDSADDLLARQQPFATHQRMVVTTLHMASDS